MNYYEGKETPVYLGNENVGDPEITDQCQERKKKNGMIDLKAYMRELVETLKTVFEKRLLYVGLQGSYLRAEATEKSDIDVMVVIDEMKPNDLKEYKKVLKEI